VQALAGAAGAGEDGDCDKAAPGAGFVISTGAVWAIAKFWANSAGSSGSSRRPGGCAAHAINSMQAPRCTHGVRLAFDLAEVFFRTVPP